MPSKSNQKIFHATTSNYERLGQMLAEVQQQREKIDPNEKQMYNSADYFRKLTASGFDGFTPTLLPPARAPFQEAVPPGYPIPEQTPMSTYGPYGSYHFPISRISLPGDTNIGPRKTIDKVKAVEAALKSNMNETEFYRKFGLTEQNAERWLRNAKKTISTRNRMGGGRKIRNARNARKKTRKTRK